MSFTFRTIWYTMAESLSDALGDLWDENNIIVWIDPLTGLVREVIAILVLDRLQFYYMGGRWFPHPGNKHPYSYDLDRIANVLGDIYKVPNLWQVVLNDPERDYHYEAVVEERFLSAYDSAGGYVPRYARDILDKKYGR